MKIYRLFFAILLSLHCCTEATAHDGTVNISGTIQDNTCELSPSSQSQTVQMGAIAVPQFDNAGDVSPAKPFSIELQNCGPAASEATVTFTGTPDALNHNLFAVENAADAASGIALGLYDSEDHLIAPGKASKGYGLEPGQTSVKLHFLARYVSVSDSITAGSAKVTASFLVNYN